VIYGLEHCTLGTKLTCSRAFSLPCVSLPDYPSLSLFLSLSLSLSLSLFLSSASSRSRFYSRFHVLAPRCSCALCFPSKFPPLAGKGRERTRTCANNLYVCGCGCAPVYLRCASAKKASNKVIDVFGPLARPQCPLRQ